MSIVSQYKSLSTSDYVPHKTTKITLDAYFCVMYLGTSTLFHILTSATMPSNQARTSSPSWGKFKLIHFIVNDVNITFGKFSSTSWKSTNLSHCTSFHYWFTVMLWQSDLEPDNCTTADFWISSFYHSQSLLTLEVIANVIEWIDSKIGTKVSSHCDHVEVLMSELQKPCFKLFVWWYRDKLT